MTSADFLQFVVTTKKNISPARPPRVSVITFTSYVCYIYTLKFGQYWTLFCIGNSSVSSMPYMQFLFVRPRFCLQLLSDSASRRTPLSSANSSYCQACSGLSPPSYYACRAHYQKSRMPRYSGFLLFTSSLLTLHSSAHSGFSEVISNSEK